MGLQMRGTAGAGPDPERKTWREERVGRQGWGCPEGGAGRKASEREEDKRGGGRGHLTQKPPATEMGAEPPPGGQCLLSRGPGLEDRGDRGAPAQGGGGVEGTLHEEEHPPEKEGDTVLSFLPEDVGQQPGPQCRRPGWASGRGGRVASSPGRSAGPGQGL